MSECATAILAYGYVWEEQHCEPIDSSLDKYDDGFECNELWERWNEVADKADLILSTHSHYSEPMLYLAIKEVTTTQGNVQHEVRKATEIKPLVAHDERIQLDAFILQMGIKLPQRSPHWFLASGIG